jgi:PAS domain S-box-containing protein
VTQTTTSAGRAADAIQSALLGEAADFADVAVVVLDDDGNHVAVNLRACALTGYTRQELLDRNASELGAAPDEIRGHLDEVSRGRRSTGKVSVRRKDASIVEVGYRAGQTRIGGIPFVVAFYWPADTEPQ